MTVRRVTCVLLAATLASAAWCSAAETGDPPVRAGFLCVWSIYLSIEAFGERCRAGKDRAFKAALADSIIQMDRYIVRNGAMSSEQLNRLKQQLGHAASTMCSDREAIRFYEQTLKTGPERLKKSVAELTAIPRKPTFDPCL